MPFATNIYDETPYIIRIKNTPDIYYEGDTCHLAGILQNNRRYGPAKPRSYAFREDFIFEFKPELAVGRRREAFCQMNGLTALLNSLPPEEPITNKLHLQLLVSYFGNGAKAKLNELKTPKAIFEWIKSSPWEVIENMGFVGLPENAPVKPAEKPKTPAIDVNAPIWVETAGLNTVTTGLTTAIA